MYLSAVLLKGGAAVVGAKLEVVEGAKSVVVADGRSEESEAEGL